jgi:DNA-binding transcriptional MerR regulator
MLIGQLSELSGYSQRMIRYLEDQGLLAPDRSESNLRAFNDGDLTRVLKIKKFKELGFTYPEIRTLIDSDECKLVHKGIELLKKHHADAHELLEKIHRLETICYGQIRTKSLSDEEIKLGQSQKKSQKNKTLDAVYGYLKIHFPELESEIKIWKFREFLSMQESGSIIAIEVVEIFRGSSQIVVLSGSKFLPNYEKAWAEKALPFYANPIGSFPFTEMKEFFGNYENIIEHKIVSKDGATKFHAIIPYQAALIASGEAVL